LAAAGAWFCSFVCAIENLQKFNQQSTGLPRKTACPALREA
jgi:hypothetical protein